jgi:16S rRNA (guanine527-N7)-methyltransferase
MVLAIAGTRGISLVEADKRKCIFLEEVKCSYGLDVGIINERAEKLRAGDGTIPAGGASCITGRAFAPLERFLELCGGLIGPRTAMFLLKGRNVGEETETAKKNWDFEYTLHDKPGGYVMELHDIKRKKQ